MDYRFLANKSLEKFFDETDLGVGEVLRVITQEKFTGIKIENRNKLTEISDKKWYEIFEKTFEYEQE